MSGGFCDTIWRAAVVLIQTPENFVHTDAGWGSDPAVLFTTVRILPVCGIHSALKKRKFEPAKTWRDPKKEHPVCGEAH